MSQTLDNLSYTWNNAGTTFTGIKYNVTDTASASGSLLMDLQVGGVSKFKVAKSGAVTTPYTEVSVFGGLNVGQNQIFLGTGLTLTRDYGAYISWCTGGAAQNKGDLYLWSDAANALAQRNGVNAQTSRIYGTYTDGSNYRRLSLSMSAGGVAEIKPGGAGTGATGNVLHISGLPTSNPGPGILWNDAGTVKVGT